MIVQGLNTQKLTEQDLAVCRDRTPQAVVHGKFFYGSPNPWGVSSVLNCQYEVPELDLIAQLYRGPIPLEHKAISRHKTLMPNRG